MVGYKGGKFYEIFVDNTILLFEDIDRNKDTYTSIFDTPILAEYKRIHDAYGTVFTLCVFWEIDAACVNMVPADKRAAYRVGWNLSQMTDKFKSEFQASSDWLRYNYHCWNAGTNYSSTARDLGSDYALTRAEVRRFAGNDSWIDFRSKMHNYSATVAQQQQIRAQGVKVLVFPPMHTQYNGFNCTPEFQQYVFNNGEGYRADTDLVYSVSSARIENVTINNDNLGVGAPMTMIDYFNAFVARTQNTWKQNPYMDYMSVETHEYCYWWDPRVMQGYWDTARWMAEHGYKPGFYDIHNSTGLRYNWVVPSFT